MGEGKYPVTITAAARCERCRNAAVTFSVPSAPASNLLGPSPSLVIGHRFPCTSTARARWIA